MSAALQLMTVAEVAESLQVSTRQVRRLIDSGDLRVVRIGTSARSDRIHPEDLAAYVEEQRRSRPRCQSIGVAIGGGLPSVSADDELESLLASPPRGQTRNA